MKTIINNIRRMFFDDGSGDRDFTEQAKQLQQARKHLMTATESVTKAAGILSDLLTSAAPKKPD